MTSAICQCTARDILQAQAHPHFPFLFSFLPHPADSGMQRFSLQLAVFRVFATHPLHIPSRIDREELSGVAMWAPTLPSSPGILAGRRHWALRAPTPSSGTGMLAGWRLWVSPPSSTGMFAGRRH